MKQAPLLLMFALHAFTNLLPVHIFNYQLLYHIGSFGLVGWLDGRFFFFVFFYNTLVWIVALFGMGKFCVNR
jgi:hypothetical protein